MDSTNKKKGMDPELTKYIPLRENENQFLIKKIIRGSINQGNEIFSDFSRGRQCTANAAIALVLSTVTNPLYWTSQSIDNLLKMGDELYISSRLARNNQVHPNTIDPEYLAASDLQPKSIVINSMSHALEFGDTIFGHRFDDNNQIGMPNLKNALVYMFTNFMRGILTINGISVAIGKLDNQFWMFDSHSRDNFAKPCSDGKACLILVDSMQSLYLLLNNSISGSNQRFGEQYDLTPISVTKNIKENNGTLLIERDRSLGLITQSDFKKISSINTDVTDLKMNDKIQRTTQDKYSSPDKEKKRILRQQSNIKYYKKLKTSSVTENNRVTSTSQNRVGIAINNLKDTTNDCTNSTPIVQSTEKDTSNITLPSKGDRLHSIEPVLDSNCKKLGVLHDKCVINLNYTYQIIKKTKTNYDNNGQHYTGPMNVLCTKCGARHFKGEKVSNKLSFGDCCAHGEVYLDNLPNPPRELKKLFDSTHPKSNDFFKRIRYYNNSLSFASFNANLVNLRKQRPGPYCFKIQGQIYYQINTALYPANDESPSYGQLFIIDAQEAIDHRLQNNSEIDIETMQLLDRLIRDNNIFAQSYKMMGEEIQNQQLIGSVDGNLPELHLCFTLKPGQDHHRFNAQRCNEVAAIFSTTANGDVPESYVTIRNKNTKMLQYVSSVDPNVEPWIYPLFHPYGTRGWHPNLLRINRNMTKNKRVSRSAYIKYRLAIRSDEFNIFLLGRRLFQQWIVDNYVKVEQDRLRFCIDNQKTLRSETYQGLRDYLESVAHDSKTKVGKITVLPSTFVGSPRNMMQHYQDSMAIVRKYGKPDLFITMTCNPKWRELNENLLPGQQQADRPDLCARVFHLKKEYLIDLIVRQKIFGEVLAYVYVIEFQKRGLPHIHLLVTLQRNCKITTSEIVDRYISAEIPDPQENKTLHDIVMKNMIHGPCGDWCIINGKCSKHYPKEFVEHTILDIDGYPIYRRRNSGKSYERPGGFRVDNRNVVPYSPELSTIFDCHINVEVVSSIKAVKYLFKYCYKGHDAASINICDNSAKNESVINHNEIKDYIEARYVGPVEACWRILSKRLQDKSHTIIRLPVHLPNEQNVIISDGDDQTAMVAALEKVNMLIDYFSLNARDKLAGNYYYSEIPLHYVFKKYQVNNKTCQRWECRKSSFKCIGRMYSVSPSQVELFHLRLLLLSVKNAKSFSDLRTVNGVLCQTYQSACLELGLIEDDEEWIKAMNEGISWMMPRGLRRLFVRILIHCQPSNPNLLWEKFKVSMSEDFIRYMDIDTAQKRMVEHISKMLYEENSSIHDFLDIEQFPIEDIENTDFDQANQIGMQQYRMLNEEQKDIIDTILNMLNCSEQNNWNAFYIDGPGGSGKTFLYTTLWYLLQGKQKKVMTMAFTGIAATLLPNGKTLHKTFGLPVPLFDDSSSNIKIQSKEAENLRKADVFIWDEAPMVPRYAMEVIDRTLRDLMNINIPFGGKIFILGGDFRQLLPIKPRGTRTEIVNLSVKFSSLWKYFKKYSLVKNMRTLPEEVQFSNFLLDMGDGKLNDADENIEIPKDCIIDTLNGDIIKEIFGNYFNEKQYEKAAQCVILAARNVDVDEINKSVVNLLNDFEEKIYTSIDSTENCGDREDIHVALLPEYLNSLSPSSLPPHELRLRVNSIIILIRNLSISEGLCNGTRLLILELGNHLLKCKILTGDKLGEIVFINRITLYCENEYPFTFKRRQFPIKLAFAMTINKAQGQTFEKVGLDLRKDVFNHGQLYQETR